MAKKTPRSHLFILRYTLTLMLGFVFLLSQNGLAFSVINEQSCQLSEDNCLSPHLVIPHAVFMQDYKRVTNTHRWLNFDIVGFFGGIGESIAGNMLKFNDLNQFLTERL